MVDAEATEATRIFYENLSLTAQQGVMFGHQDDLLYGHSWSYEPGRSDVLECAGAYPAVFGWELSGLEVQDSVTLDGVPYELIRKGIREAHAMGCVNTISIHWRNPVTGQSAWDSKYKDTVAKVLNDPEVSALYDLWVDRLAEFLSSLTTEDGNLIPVIFRPLHENSGGAFWWGCIQCTPQEYKDLWIRTVARLRDVCGVHNLIYMYSTDIVKGEDDFLSRYPGDEWVDMLGIDAYHRQQEWDFHQGCQMMMNMLSSVGHRLGKPYAFSETGLEGIPDENWWTQWLLPAIQDKGLSYVLVWRNAWNMDTHFFGPWKGCSSESDFVDFVNNDKQKIFLQNNLPQMYE